MMEVTKPRIGALAAPTLEHLLQNEPRGGPQDRHDQTTRDGLDLDLGPPLPPEVDAESRALRPKLLAWNRSVNGRLVNGTMVGSIFGAPFGFCLVLSPFIPALGIAGMITFGAGAIYASRHYRPTVSRSQLRRLLPGGGA